jgi:hypothetical protein
MQALLKVSISLTLFYSIALCSQSDSFFNFQLALEKAKSGDTVFIPSGEFILNKGFSIKAGITIKGAGQKKTILRHTKPVKDWLFNIRCSDGERVRISDMTLHGVSFEKSPGIRISGGPKNLHIHDMTFIRCNDRAIEIHGNSTGVIDNCTFIDNAPTAVVVFGDGDEGWERPLSLGTDQAIFVEDCYFEQKNIPDPDMAHHIASNNGSRYVFRYNRINDGKIRSSAVDAHGNKYYWPRGSRSYEVYNNTFIVSHRWAGLNLRGGDGVVFNNDFFGDIVSPVHLLYEGKSSDNCEQYPCMDQIRQLHIWNNTYNQKPFEIKVRHPETIKLNQDYFLSPPKKYIPFTYPHPLRNAHSKTR